MTIYFAGAIRGSREGLKNYQAIIEMLRRYGEVLTEHVGYDDIDVKEGDAADTDIYDRDMSWLKECEFFVADVTYPSLGVGYEVAQAEMLQKKILCLFHTSTNRHLTAMIAGNQALTVKTYSTVEEVKSILNAFLVEG
jgi:hypothetical protein